MTEELKKYFRNLLKLVEGLHAIYLIDRDGVPVFKVQDEKTPPLFTYPKFLSTGGTAIEQSGKLGLGANKTIVAMYQNFQIVTFNKLPIIVTMIASKSANTGMMLGLEKEMDPIIQDIRTAVDMST